MQFDWFLSVLEQKWLENHEIYYIGAAELPLRFPRCAPLLGWRYLYLRLTFFSEVKSPGMTLFLLSLAALKSAIYSKLGVKFPLEVMTEPKIQGNLLRGFGNKINRRYGISIWSVKSSGFKKAVNWQCQTPARSCQHLNFCFPCKRGLYWLRSQYWEASADSLNFFLIFLSCS